MNQSLRNFRIVALGLLLATGHAVAGDPQALPEWDKLTAQQREQLIAPIRERWDSEPEQRTRMLEHAQRWQRMTPEQREKAHRGMRRFEKMSPEQRREARALFEKMQGMGAEQRKQLVTEWKAMTPEQRRAWVERNPPRDPPPGPPPR
ncbi:hypothetical protein CSC70_11850 [Pseudoxanthomonas kalamensis DSM 18571]|uniref:DUF3106 domain-containing protein n=1 Tax=Pseudoxanthomonas kalamensis TaxID=289483 RepID=UPI0013914988|nr:DUF3106 domain-containing protein [Pseudoxanthomonas kalamensis]KAF1708798.1 hypothetical protein CSC70_11850 [Pseudoxanthomonas kalamensis DSM 18571]